MNAYTFYMICYIYKYVIMLYIDLGGLNNIIQTLKNMKKWHRYNNFNEMI